MQTVIVYAALHCFWRNLMLFCIEILKRGTAFRNNTKNDRSPQAFAGIERRLGASFALYTLKISCPSSYFRVLVGCGREGGISAHTFDPVQFLF